MAFAQFPAPAAGGGGSQDGFSFTATDFGVDYEITQAFEAGVYAITTSPIANQAEVVFVDATQSSPKATTVGGIITVALSFDGTNAYIKATGDGTQVTIDKVADTLAGVDIAVSGTVDTVSTTSTYNQTGLLSVVVISGGTGGGGGATNGLPNTNVQQGGGLGGNGGRTATFTGFVNTATSVTIGAGGNGGANTSGGGSSGATSFGAYAISPVATHSQSNMATLPGGLTEARGGFPFQGSIGSSSVSTYKSIQTGTFGGGGGGESSTGGPSGGAKAGGGSGIGTGGTGSSDTNLAGGDATGFASGGGGGKNNSAGVGTTGGLGSAGVVYIIRGF